MKKYKLDISKLKYKHQLTQCSREQGLKENYLVPHAHHYFDASTEYIDKAGRNIKIDQISETSGERLKEAVRSVNETGGGKAILDIFLPAFREYRNTTYPQAQALIACDHQKEAQNLKSYVESFGVTALVAVSDDPQSRANLKAFKIDKKNAVLISVNMAAEGYNVPSINHICLLTTVTADVYVTQLITRGSRYDPSFPANVKQQNHIYCLKDPRLIEVFEQMRAPGDSFADIKLPGDQTTAFSGSKFNSICPLKSDIKAEIPIDFESGRPLPVTCVDQALQAANIQLSPEQIEAFAEKITKQPQAIFSLPISPKDEEIQLRKTIEEKVRQLAHGSKHEPKDINKALKKEFGKSRKNMTLTELKKCFSLVAEALDKKMEEV